MSYLQPYQQNPIQRRKDAVRRYSRNTALWTGGGVVVGGALGLMSGSFGLFLIIAVIGCVGGFLNWRRVQKIVNFRDPQ